MEDKFLILLSLNSYEIGFFKRTYQINDLTSCASVRCNLLNGFGIRKIANGWLYNISGILFILDLQEISQLGKYDIISFLLLKYLFNFKT